MPSCHICSLEVNEDEGFECSDCGAFTCYSCGDNNMCNECLGDEVLLGDVLDLE